MAEEFVSEAIQPVAETIETARMAVGEPGLPQLFQWKRQTIRIVKVLKTWRETGPCHHGSGEAYVHKHWFEVVSASGSKMKIYFERQPRSGKNKSRWWLFSIEEPDEPNHAMQNTRGPQRTARS